MQAKHIVSVMFLLSTRIVVPPVADTATVPGASAPATSEGPQARIAEACAPFRFEDGALTITTDRTTIRIEGGAITYIEDRASGEVLVNTSACEQHDANANAAAGLNVKDAAASLSVRAPGPLSDVEFAQVDHSTARLKYVRLFSQGGTDRGGCLVFEVTVDAASGEILLTASGTEADSAWTPCAINVPVMCSTAPRVILGSGAMYSREDPPATDRTTHVDYGLYAPTMAVIEGLHSVVAAWSETTRFAPEFVQLEHRPECDRLILRTEPEAAPADTQTIVSAPWRIGTYRAWEQAARRWRAMFERRTGAKPLWENRAPWVRNIHAVFDASAQDYGPDEAKYAALAALTPPERTLFLMWNGDRIVLYGDHSLVDVIARPSPSAARLIERYDWPLLLYHPYTIIHSQAGAARRLAFLQERGWLPPAYRFKPDYPGAAGQWHAYWEDISADYEDGSKYLVLHTGTKRFKEHFAGNLANYLAKYSADGAYLDTLGVDQAAKFPHAKRSIEGLSYVQGEARTLAIAAAQMPNAAFMSEYQAPWILPFVFYSWEGPATRLTQGPLAGTRINHPLRVALIGSYVWARESNETIIDEAASALLGALPQISLEGDAGITPEQARRSQQRAKFFCDEELFNDLPEEWADDAIAYYRGSRTGRWFKLIRRDADLVYVRTTPGGVRATQRSSGSRRHDFWSGEDAPE